MTRVAVFDINETTLDLQPVRQAVDQWLGPQGGFLAWFQRLLQLSMATTATGVYLDFSTLAASAFRAVADTSGPEVGAEGWADVAAAMGRLEPHPDVAEGLARLREEGWTVIALTNSAQASVDAQLERAGLAPLFDHVLSVDQVKAYKPSAEPYRLAAAVAGEMIEGIWMVACHDWDLAGARAAGMSTAYVRRPGLSYADVFAPAELAVDDFVQLADALIENG